jgi:hypothetical protein
MLTVLQKIPFYPEGNGIQANFPKTENSIKLSGPNNWFE